MSAPVAAEVDEATIETVVGGCIGWKDGRRTMLKSSMHWAQQDIANGRFVCAAWPECRHRDADECSRARRRSFPRWRADE